MSENILKNRSKGRINTSLVFLAMLICFMAGQTTSFAANVALSWDANTESDLAGYKVYYNVDSSALPFNGTGALEGVSPLDTKNLTSATISGLDPNHSYSFAVTAYNTSGVESPYSNTVSIPESAPPTVSLSSPANNATVSGTVSVTASASDNIGVTKVEYYVNGVLKASDTSSPYVYSWNTSTLTTGSYTLLARAYDAAGNSSQSSAVSVTVVNDTTAPTVSLTAPGNGSTLSGYVAISATASDNVGVSKVEFYSNGALLFAGNVAPYSYSWNTASVANGSYTLTARAYDAVGNSTLSSNLSVTVNNVVSDSVAPTVSISAPANGATVSGTVTVSSAASDNVGVTKVEFYVNGVLRATDTASPYAFSWNTTAETNGSYTLTSKTYDVAGNVGQSANVTVTVSNSVAPPPSGNFTAVFGNAAGANYPNTVQDTFININTDVNATSTALKTYTWPANTPANAILMKWDVSALPANAQIQSATLSLYQTGSGGDSLYEMPVSEIINKSPGIANCNGNTYDGLNSWTPSSVPYNSIPLAQSDIAPAVDAPQIDTASGYKSWNVTNIIKDWLTNSANNRGLMLNSSMKASSDSNRVFASSEATDSSQRPKLVVTYTLASETIAPTVAISAPANGATVSGTVAVSTAASDNVGVTKVEFYVNGVLQATDTASPYTFSWNTTAVTNGSYALIVKAYDAAGNVGQSAQISVNVLNSATPTVTISSPNAGSKVAGSNVAVSSSASDQVAITKMELYIDNVLKTTTSSSNLAWTWNVKPYAKGAHVINVKAYDAANKMSSSSITVYK